jgi:hypothetical protein
VSGPDDRLGPNTVVIRIRRLEAIINDLFRVQGSGFRFKITHAEVHAR